MLKLTDKIKVEVSFSGINLSCQTLTLKALLDNLEILPEDHHLFLTEDGFKSLQEILCYRLCDSPNIGLVKIGKKSITHKEWNKFLDWLHKKYPDFCFYSETGLSDRIESLREDLEHEYVSDPYREYKITDIAKLFPYIEYQEKDKYKTKAVKGLLEKWIEEVQDEA